MHLLLLILQQLLGVLTGSTAEPAPVPAADSPPAGEPHRGMSKFIPLLERPTPPSFRCNAPWALTAAWFRPLARASSAARAEQAGRCALIGGPGQPDVATARQR